MEQHGKDKIGNKSRFKLSKNPDLVYELNNPTYTTKSKPADELRILCLGDSITDNDWVGQSPTTFPVVLEKFLNVNLKEPWRSCTVVNSAVTGYNAIQCYEWYKKQWKNHQFDYVILNESLQQVLDPQKAIEEALRVGRKVIVGIPNFCHFIGRFQIFFMGRVPVTKELPYQWYNTPNLRFFSIKDFRAFCKKNRVKISHLKALGLKKEVSILPNLFEHFGVFILTK